MTKKYSEMTGSELKRDWVNFYKKLMADPEESKKFMGVWGQCDGLIFDMEDAFYAWFIQARDSEPSHGCNPAILGWQLTGTYKNYEVPNWMARKILVRFTGYNRVDFYVNDEIEES